MQFADAIPATLSALLVLGPLAHAHGDGHLDPPVEPHTPAPQPGLHIHAVTTAANTAATTFALIHGGVSLPTGIGVELQRRG